MTSLARRMGFAIMLALPATAIAQNSGGGFLLGTPSAALTFHAGWAGARARSDLFSFTTSELTLDHGDFSSPTIGADLAINIFPRTQLMLSSDLSGVDRRSEFRHFIDNSHQPIEQQTQFRRVPVTLSIKQYLNSTGRSIGKLAWIPTRAAAYVGAGGGWQYYRFKQDGDFIDPESLEVFGDRFESEGWAGVGHVLAGLDYTLTPELALTTEGRYVWSHADLSSDFSGFKPIDLSGFTTTVGLTIRF